MRATAAKLPGLLSAGQIVAAPLAFVGARAPAIVTFAPCHRSASPRHAHSHPRPSGASAGCAGRHTQARPAGRGEVQQPDGRTEGRLQGQRRDEEVKRAAQQRGHVKALGLPEHVAQLDLEAACPGRQVHGPDLVGRAPGARQEQAPSLERGSRHAAGRHRTRQAPHRVDRRGRGGGVCRVHVRGAVGEQVVSARRPQEPVGRRLDPHRLGDLGRVELHVVAERKRVGICRADRTRSAGVAPVRAAGGVALEREQHALAVGPVERDVPDVVVALHGLHRRGNCRRHRRGLTQPAIGAVKPLCDAGEVERRCRPGRGHALPVEVRHGAPAAECPAPRILRLGWSAEHECEERGQRSARRGFIESRRSSAACSSCRSRPPRSARRGRCRASGAAG